MEQGLLEQVAGRFNPSIIGKIARNTRSSWTQSGHLVGRVKKVRQRAIPSPGSTAFACFLAYLEGRRAQRLFDSIWVRLLDAQMPYLMELARSAGQRGWIDFKYAGSVIEVRFPGILTADEEDLLREQD